MSDPAASTQEPVVDSTVKASDHASEHDVKLTPFTLFRYVASIGLLIFSIIIVGALIFTGNTRVASDANSWVALIVCVSGFELDDIKIFVYMMCNCNYLLVHPIFIISNMIQFYT